MTKTYTVHTDADGSYNSTQTFRLPGPFGLTVDLFATVTSPTGAHITCTVSLDNSSGPQTKTFTSGAGVKVSLGSWRIASGDDALAISGKTIPALPNTDVTIDLEADLDGF